MVQFTGENKKGQLESQAAAMSRKGTAFRVSAFYCCVVLNKLPNFSETPFPLL